MHTQASLAPGRSLDRCLLFFSAHRTCLALLQISEAAPFSSAFREKVGWRWASSVVGAGASMGIVASLLVAMLGQARYLCVISRARLVPLWFAKVHPSTGTPMNATIFLGTPNKTAETLTLKWLEW